MAGVRHVAFLLCFAGLPLQGQISSRAGEIEAARQKRAPDLAPDEISNLEQALSTIRNRKLVRIFTTGISGFRVKVGGLVPGSSFAAGPEYIRRDLADGNMIFRSSARVSVRKFQIYDLQLSMPKLAGEKAFLDLHAVHRNFPWIDYYGPGPDSLKVNRTNFRLEDTAYDAVGGVAPLRNLKLGVTGGYLQVNVGPGADRRFVSTERVFSPLVTPGLDRQPNFLRGGAFAQYDYRDNPEGARKGGNYLAQYSHYSDRELGLHSFRRLDLEVQQYFPFFNERRVIALRGKSALTWAGRGQSVPFYLQPTLGGPDHLRGFRAFRFYDNNLMVLTAEYRWEVFSGLDMAVFGDAGKVFRRRAQWNLDDLEGAYGLGFRFNVRNDVFLRVDVAYSHEGLRVWTKFSNVF